MITRLCRAERWLDEVGIRHAVLVVAALLGTAIITVARLGLGGVDEVTGAARGASPSAVAPAAVDAASRQAHAVLALAVAVGVVLLLVAGVLAGLAFVRGTFAILRALESWAASLARRTAAVLSDADPSADPSEAGPLPADAGVGAGADRPWWVRPETAR